MSIENSHCILICGETGTGKSASLRNIANPERWWYANCEAGKALPFRAKFKSSIITQPTQVRSALQALVKAPDADGIIIDTLTYLMDMFESRHVVNAIDGRDAWSDYQQFFKNMMSDDVANLAKANKYVLFLAHTMEGKDSFGNITRTVPIKGALKNSGVESYFNHVIATKKMRLLDLEKFANPLLTITPRDEQLGYKHVFQTQPTKETTGERIRGAMDMWTFEETFIDNDIQIVIDRFNQFYGQP